MRRDPKEIELKLSLTPADFAALKAHRRFGELFQSPVHTETLNAVYYDTDKSDLRAHGLTLRVRREGNQFVQTIKSAALPAGMLERDQWEHPLQDGQIDLAAAANTALGPVLTAEVRASLRPVFETRVRRTYYHLADSAWRIEIAFDEGEVVAGNHSVPICEIELELKYGYRAALFEFARMIVEVVPARLTFVAKSERGYALLSNEAAEAQPAPDGELVPGATTAQHFKRIACGCLHQLIANAPHVHRRNPKALHQARIALRRLRTAISIFSDVVHDSQVQRIKAELKWLNGELSRARDLDTLLDEVVKPLHRLHPGHRGLRSLHLSFARQSRVSYERAINAIHSLRFCSLLIETYSWIEIGEWATTTDHSAQLRRDTPIEMYAIEQLSRRRRKIVKRGRKLEKLGPERRHNLRIQVKKVRYATEFFADLFQERKSAKRGSKFLHALKRLQTSLGELNDVATRSALCGEILRKMDDTAAADGRGRAFAAGLIAGNEEARLAKLLSEAGEAHARFEDIKPFWK